MTRKLYLEPAAVTYPDGTKFHSDAAMQQAIDDIMLLRAALENMIERYGAHTGVGKLARAALGNAIEQTTGTEK